MERIQPEPCGGTNQNPIDNEPKPAGTNPSEMFVGDCQPVERKLWNPQGLVICRSCGKSNWLQSFFGYTQTGLDISALLCRECYDLAVVRHVKYDMEHFIMSAYYVAIMTEAGESQYRLWGPAHGFKTMASRATFDRVRPPLPPGFRKGKLWSGVTRRSRK
jgi:hypothetical protein